MKVSRRNGVRAAGKNILASKEICKHTNIRKYIGNQKLSNTYMHDINKKTHGS